MKLCKLILLTLFISGCGFQSDITFVDPALLEYADHYADLKLTTGGKEYDYKVGLHFEKLPSPINAQCRKTQFQRWIVLDPIVWESANEDKRELLILHEMGHCDLHLPHTINYKIMNETLISIGFYKKNRVELIESLFLLGE